MDHDYRMEQDANVAAQLRMLASLVERGAAELAGSVVWTTGAFRTELTPNRSLRSGYAVAGELVMRKG